MTIKIYFFSKKLAKKSSKKNLWKRKLKINFFSKNIFLMVILSVTIVMNIFFLNSKKKLRSCLKKHNSGLFRT